MNMRRDPSVIPLNNYTAQEKLKPTSNFLNNANDCRHMEIDKSSSTVSQSINLLFSKFSAILYRTIR